MDETRYPGGPKKLSKRAGRMALAVVAVVVAATPHASRSGSRAAQAPVHLGHYQPVATRTGTYLGAYVKPDSGSFSKYDVKRQITKLEHFLGRKLAIDHHYYPFDSTFPTWVEKWDLSKGRIPMISWGITYPSEINSGKSDALIRSRARGVKALGKPVLLRWGFEMESFYNNDTYNVTGSNFTSAWRRIWHIFHRVGARKVQWVWCPNAYGFDHKIAKRYYPGGKYVDWICADGYNWGGSGYSWSHWQSFRDIFRGFYRWGKRRGKPLMVAETGALEAGTGKKAKWISAIASAIRYRMPKIHALVYFDANSTDDYGKWFDWRVNTSRPSYRAFRRLARRALFRPPHNRFL